MNPGTVVAERFEIERHVTSGGMGAVYRARDLHTGLPVALKVMLPPESSRDAPAIVGDERERFEREARALSELRHPGIVRYVDHGLTAEGEPYLAMEWLEGEDLGRRLARAPLTALESVLLTRTLSQALAPAHEQGVIHRDLKPSNLFLPGADLARVRILDFGVARVGGDTRANTRSGTLLGTPGYMAPEQARGDRDIDARVDVFALGCVLFECLTGRPAFKGEHVMAVLAKILLEESPRLRDHRRDLPEALDGLLTSMLAKDREARPRDGAAVALLLDALLANEVIEGAIPPIERATRESLTSGEQNVVSVVVAAEAYGRETAIAATLTPDGATAKADRLREAVAPFGARLEVLADGSWVACLLGDRGSRSTASDRASQAARCALVMRQHMPSAPMVLATGRAVFAGRLPVGDVIDRAARVLRPLLVRGAPSLSVNSAPLVILLDDVTAGLLDVRFDIGGGAPDAEIGSLSSLELRGEREVVDKTRTLLGKATPCIGRERELASLAATYDECITEPVARVVLVTAPAGVGKSRLRHEFVQNLASHDHPPQVWLGRGDPLRAGSPFALLAPALRRSAGILDGEPLELRRRKLRARVGRHVALEDWNRVTVFLGEMIDVSFEGEGENEAQLRAARQDAMLMGDQKLRAFVDFLAGECADGPLLLVLEDLHWGDGPSVKFLDAALRTLADAPLMVLALARPEATTRFPDLWAGRGVQPLSLVELTAKRSGRLVRAVLGETIDESRVARIVERAQGNAFYLEELIRAVAEGRGDDLPETVLAMVQGRLDRLDPDARRVLRAASIFGEVFWRRGALALLGDDADATRADSPASVSRKGALDRWFDDLVRNEVIRRRGPGKFPGEEEFSFRHAMVRDAAYAMLTPEDRTLGHRLAGEWLENAGETEAVVLAEHYTVGGERRRARASYRRAAEQALRANDLEAAIDRADKAITLGAEGEELGALRCMQAEARRWRGELGGARSCAMEAMEHLPAASDAWYAAAAELALSAGRLGEHESLVALMNRIAPYGLDEGCSPSCLVAWARVSGQLLLAGKRTEAEVGFSRIDRVAHSFASEPALSARVSLTRAMRALTEGDAGAYRDHTSEAADSFARAGDRRSSCMQRVSVGYASLGLGDHDDAQATLEEALVAAQAMGLANVVAYSKNNLGLALARKGRLDDARRIETEAIASFAAQGDGRLEHSSRVYLAQMLRQAGDLAGAEREANAAIEFFRVASPLRAFAFAVRAEIALSANDTDDAFVAASEARGLLRELGHLEEGEALVRLVHAEALRAKGAIAESRGAIEEARMELLQRAARIKDEARRQSFLERVPENARTLLLASAWSS